MMFQEMVGFLNDEILSIVGSPPEPTYELHLADAEHVDEHTLDWSVKENVLRVPKVQGDSGEWAVVIKVKNAKRAIAKIGNEFFVKHEVGIHPTAVIEEGAKIGKNCYIGPHVVIHSCVEVGDNVRIKAGAVIGNEGFGFERDEKGDLFRFPQLGRVIIADGVEVGSNTTIDRGALSDTVIGRNTKINNLVHIAHNVRIGANVAITAQVDISGSSVIGGDVWIGPGSTIRDHVTIGDNAYVGIGSNVVKDIPEDEVWCGNPARKLRDR